MGKFNEVTSTAHYVGKGEEFKSSGSTISMISGEVYETIDEANINTGYFTITSKKEKVSMITERISKPDVCSILQ